jgi:hypothetical protein
MSAVSGSADKAEALAAAAVVPKPISVTNLLKRVDLLC